MAVGQRGIIINDMDSLWRFSTAVAKSGLAPKGIQTGEAIFVAIQMGLEVGMTPMAALQNIAVINGRPSIWGDAQLALVRGTGELEVFEEWFETNGEKLPRNPVTFQDSTTAVCRVKRRGYPATEVGFSVADAKTAGLWGKEGPWRQYPFRMLRSRARSFALRDTFGDALKGIMSGEEAQDAPFIDVPTTTSEPAQPPPQALPEPPRISRARKPAQQPAETAGATTTTAQEPTQTTTQAAADEPKPAESPGGAATSAPPAPPAPAGPVTGLGTGGPTVQEDLASIIGGAGYSFDQFLEVCVKLTDVPESDKLATTFGDLSQAFARRMVSSKAGLLRALKGQYGEGGAK